MSTGSEGEAKNGMRYGSQLTRCARPARRERGTPSTLRQLITHTYRTVPDRAEADRRVILIVDQFRAGANTRKFGQGLAKTLPKALHERATT